MALTKAQATAIVDTVAADALSTTRINKSNADSVLTRVMPESWGASGAMRNWGFIAVGASPDMDQAGQFVCVGIQQATEKALESKLKTPGGLPGVKSVGEASRNGTLGTYHVATLITMDDGSEYVFDWHATLNTRNPMISRHADWKRSSGGMPYATFSGM